MENTSKMVFDGASLTPQPEELFDSSKTISSAIYLPLQTEKQEIRLLIIEPGSGEDAIYANLSTVSLNDDPVYEALSYTWGEPKLTHAITLDGKLFHVRENLSAALRRLRLTDKPRNVWIDAICINQDDVSERNSQVLLMARVYTSCRQCLVWVGEQDGETEAAIHLIQLWSQDIHFSEWEHLQKDLTAVANFVERPWWSRVWTAQELLLPAKKVVLCGGHWLSWETLILAREALWRHQTGCCREKSFSSTIAYEDLLGRFIFAVQSFTSITGSTYLEIAGGYRNRQATDPRDKLIALLSFADPKEQGLVVPDYSQDLQVLYTDFTVKHIRKYGSLLPLSSILDNPPNADLPSWVPDWRLPVSDIIEQVTRNSRYDFFDACCGLRADIVTSRWNDKVIMRENGILFDYVKYVADDSGDPEEEAEPKLKRWYDYAKLTLHNSYATGETFEEAFWRTMILDTTFEIGDTPVMYVERTTPTTTATIVGYGSKLIDPGWHGYEDLDFDLAEAACAFALRSAILRRRFYITERGYMGLGTARMQVGDMVYVMSGGNLPLILRAAKAQDGLGLPDGVDSTQQLCTLIGDCYVHGLMDGELIKERGGELKPVYLI